MQKSCLFAWDTKQDILVTFYCTNVYLCSFQRKTKKVYEFYKIYTLYNGDFTSKKKTAQCIVLKLSWPA